MRSELEEVCQSLMAVSYWIPGSPQTHAASAILRNTSRAFSVSTGSPLTTARVCQVPSDSTACMNSSFTRTEWLPFWKKIEPYASPVKLAS